MIDFYHTKRWEKLRLKVLRRDNYLCQECRRYGRQRQATTVHHIKHREEFPELQWEPSNLISLCNDCHNKQHPEKAARKNKLYPRP